jgi:Na+-transporting NADH:ubiquinone oxidoreductase subunit B
MVDGMSGATVLADAANGVYTSAEVAKYSFADMFFGFIPGSIGETSTLMVLIGAAILIGSGVGSWRIILSMILGASLMGILIEVAGANFFGVDHFYYHLVAGGFAFGTVFMATDPVSAAQTDMGKWFYGFFAGALAIMIRVVNPAYPEGIMLAILLMNVFAPLIDYFVVSANKKRRLSRATV